MSRTVSVRFVCGLIGCFDFRRFLELNFLNRRAAKRDVAVLLFFDRLANNGPGRIRVGLDGLDNMAEERAEVSDQRCLFRRHKLQLSRANSSIFCRASRSLGSHATPR